MEEAEFDKFAEEYSNIHNANIRLSGENSDFFSEYKIQDLAKLIDGHDSRSLDILDFGCGVGKSIPYMHKYFPQSHLTGLDVSQKSLNIARHHHAPIAEFQHFDGQQIPYPDASFDIIFTACVFHHIDEEEHESLFTEIYRCLKPGGMFVIFEHNPLNPLTVHAVNTCPFDENAKLIISGRIKKKLTHAHFSDIKLCYRIFFPSLFKRLRPAEMFLTKLPLGAQYYLAAKKTA
ncbi:class I SAM-dependent methyltransferase [Aestuariicella hydrocarbonica]|uniref:Class I SAM-dependent methyltransferase n=1 Tax=Pseudomaricurvus hydrocarbonicus TaxID=1470433 RepID=A0A9E5JYQ9_9GAMM|nr:class I SAM-dependent methyltransferase [Aestuariicella hydrocarbonica]NHO64667.1 class I SAM-dependent methyltransferase [Aestuariicella hydrocarbonica]